MKIESLFTGTTNAALTLLAGIALLFACTEQPPAPQPDISIGKVADENRIEIMAGQELFTAYIYPDDLAKPVLFPVNAPGEVPLTRGFPVHPRTGERTDHPHQVGFWLSYGNVNGLDFWNNPGNLPEENRAGYGYIEHGEVLRMEGGRNKGELVISAYWKNYSDEIILTEVTTFVFSIEDDTRIIDRVTTLTAGSEEVNFADDKEGMAAVRVAREMELPGSDLPVIVGPDGSEGQAGSNYHEGSTGNYLSSEGLEGDDVWGTRARWMILNGKMHGKEVSIALIDHPENPGYPTYWHARGYGLFSANPLGQAEFSEGSEVMNMVLPAGESVTFRYRLAIRADGIITPGEMDNLASNFTKHIL
ncbi:MAG: hypothetical protein EA408_10205 [Marinilabiliales bacterium]|nr:MAG: hypothetical protein EA408_10205 [Marinilabiliales bacterium]